MDDLPSAEHPVMLRYALPRLGEFLFKQIEGIAAYSDPPVRFGVVESINATIKAVLRRARGDVRRFLHAAEVHSLR
jgi:transposase